MRLTLPLTLFRHPLGLWQQRACVLVVGLCLFLPGFFGLAVMDRDEARFAQASRQMLETGDFVAIRFQHEARNKKPAGMYWLQTSTVRLAEVLGVPHARQTIGLYRLPSLLAALALMLLTFELALAMGLARGALEAAVLMGCVVILGLEARQARTDALTSALILPAMLALWQIWPGRTRQSEASGAPMPALEESSHRWRPACLLWTALAASLMVKGPVGLLVVGLTALALSLAVGSGRWLLALRPLVGLAWCLALVLPWLVAIQIRTGGAFLGDAVGGDMLGKVTGGAELHGFPPGFYMLGLFLTGWPLGPLVALAAPVLVRRWRDPVVMFLLCWLVPSWLVFEIMPTKLPHYVLPLYPALALLVAWTLHLDEQHATEGEGRRWWRLALAGWLVLLPLVLIVAGGALAFYYHADPVPGVLYWVGALGAGLIGAFALRGWRRLSLARLVPVAAGLAFCTALSVYAGLVSHGSLDRFFGLSARLADEARALGQAAGCPDPALVSAGYREPSLVFLTRTDILLTEGAGAAEFLRGGPCRVAIVESREESAFHDKARQRGQNHILRARVRGYNVNRNMDMDMGFYLRGPLP